jgi:hypothetical protein
MSVALSRQKSKKRPDPEPVTSSKLVESWEFLYVLFSKLNEPLLLIIGCTFGPRKGSQVVKHPAEEWVLCIEMVLTYASAGYISTPVCSLLILVCVCYWLLCWVLYFAVMLIWSDTWLLRTLHPALPLSFRQVVEGVFEALRNHVRVSRLRICGHR